MATQSEGTARHVDDLIAKLKKTIKRQAETLEASQAQLKALEAIKK